MQNDKVKSTLRTNSRLRKKLIFYICLVLIPSVQFAIFYVYVNFNSFVLAFQEYVALEGSLGYDIEFAAFNNFKEAFSILFTDTYYLTNSLLWFVCKVAVGISLALLFSFYIYKKYPLSGFFRVFLFMPQIISGVVFSLLFKYIVTDVYIVLMESVGAENVLGLLDNPSTRQGVTIFYNIWMGFGVNVLLFSGGMSAIDTSVVESAQLDGVNLIEEFIYITIPMIWSTLTSFLIVALTGVFTDQMNLHALFSNLAGELGTFGYFLFVNASNADILPKSGQLTYSVLSAVGLILTAIVLPITLIVRHLLTKFGPSED